MTYNFSSPSHPPFQLGAADYIAVAENYHTVFIYDIPVMSMRIRDKVRLIFVLTVSNSYLRYFSYTTYDVMSYTSVNTYTF